MLANQALGVPIVMLARTLCGIQEDLYTSHGGNVGAHCSHVAAESTRVVVALPPSLCPCAVVPREAVGAHCLSVL